MADEPKFFYSNSVGVAHSAWDVTYSFQRVAAADAAALSAGGPLQAKVWDRLDVALSPAHAKLFAAVAFQTMFEYEQSQGTIALPPDQQMKYDALISSIKSALK